MALRGRLRSPLIDMRITQELLRRHGATQEQVDRVARIWPTGAEPTAQRLAEAAAIGLDILWLQRLLPVAVAEAAAARVMDARVMAARAEAEFWKPAWATVGEAALTDLADLLLAADEEEVRSA